jgi:hypothetical protein
MVKKLVEFYNTISSKLGQGQLADLFYHFGTAGSGQVRIPSPVSP